jgi:YidC/Oxa1 family membrane protein insertase
VKELSEGTRLVLAGVLGMVVVLVWSHFFLQNAPLPQQKNGTAASTQNPGNSSSQPTQISAALTSPAASAAGKPTGTPSVQDVAERNVVVESLLNRVELTNRGGVVRSWELKKYLTDEKPPRPQDLVNVDAAKELGWPLSIVMNDPTLEAEANNALYQITPSSPQVPAPATVTMQWSDGHLSVTKTLKFSQDYQTAIEATVLVDGKPVPFAIAWRGQFGDRAVYQAPQLLTAFYKQAGKLNLLQYRKLGTQGEQTKPLDVGGPVDFAGIQDQFFAATFMPAGSDIAFWDWTQWHHYTANNQTQVDPEAQVAVGPVTPGTLEANVFVGPKDLAVLSAQKPSLEELINYGWTGIIAKPLLFALQWMYRFIPDYGWVIVIFTVLLNTVLLPVKIWSFKSARKMQVVAPEIKAIQDRYKKYSMRDPRKQKMNEEVMAVYQREGINPVGSCLPMLVQLPILWAFYRTLAYSIELRHAPWGYTWIHDLAARDPYYILPIAMAVTMFLMQKLTPMPAGVDPAQQRMMLLMPILFVVIFFRYASGLNLYYFTANFVGAAQQWYLNRAHPLPSRSKFKKNREANDT